ncbi:MAG: DUF983 domain-containing protein [Euryarchaeota archaeon]|nr:DUF983 domain-containing protein [Euryarchaeota archaeon]
MRREKEKPGVLQAAGRGLIGHCPRCDDATMFRRWSAPNRSCRTCGLRFRPRGRPQDHLAAFVLTALLGITVSGLAVWFFIDATPFGGMAAALYSVPLLAAVFIVLFHPVVGLVTGLKARRRAGAFR